MKVLVLADIHGAVDELERILGQERDVDLVLVAGGITDPTEPDAVATAGAVIDALDAQHGFVKAVPGNMDTEPVLKALIKHRMNLHKDIFSMADYDFVGFGAYQDMAEDEAARAGIVRQLLERTKAAHRAVVCHTPPKNTAVDRTHSGEQVGDPALRDLLEAGGVDLVICGHVHEAQGSDRIGDTAVINPGAVKDGNYAVLDVDGGEVRARFG